MGPDALKQGLGLSHPGDDPLTAPGCPPCFVPVKQRPGDGGNAALTNLDTGLVAEAGQRVGIEGGVGQVRVVDFPVAGPADKTEPGAVNGIVREQFVTVWRRFASNRQAE